MIKVPKLYCSGGEVQGEAALLGFTWLQRRPWKWMKRNYMVGVGCMDLVFQLPCQTV